MSMVSNAIGKAATYATGFMPQMMIGSYMFSLNTSAYQELNRDTEYRWVALERYGQDDALQYTGPGTDTVTLAGVVYPSYRGGGGQLNKLRALADQGLPHIMVDGVGNIYGNWVITKVTEKQSTFAALGQPLKQEFTIELRRHSGGPSNLINSLIRALNPFGLVTGVQGLVAGAKNAIGGAVNGVASEIGTILF